MDSTSLITGAEFDAMAEAFDTLEHRKVELIRGELLFMRFMPRLVCRSTGLWMLGRGRCVCIAIRMGSCFGRFGLSR